MRDKLCDSENLNEVIALNDKGISEELEDMEILKEDIKNGIQRYPLKNEQVIFNIKVQIFYWLEEEIRAKYSLGLECEDIETLFFQAKSYITEIGYTKIGYINMLELVALGILLEVSENEFQILVDVADDAKVNDILLDCLINAYGMKRNFLSSGYEKEKPYKEAVEIIESAISDKTKATVKLEEYVQKKWLKGHSDYEWTTAHKRHGYVGLWSFEAAAIAKIFDLDDSKLKEDNHYPYDLAHYKNAMTFNKEIDLAREELPEDVQNDKLIPANPELEQMIPNEFARAMGILLFARVGREATRMTWRANSYDAFESGDLEICREIVIRSIRESSKSDVANGNKAFIPLSQESADENVADIMGMITDELGELSDEEYEDLLDDFAALLVQWRALEVPKCQDEDAYELVYELVQRCYEHKAYRTATRLSGLLYVADERKKKPNLAKTNLLMGKIMYELGYMEVAKRCFMFADEDTKSGCWKDVSEKYHALLEQETKLEITEEVLEKQKFIDDGIASGKFKGYTLEECRKYRAGELEIEFLDPKKQDKEREKIAEKALKTYGKHANGDSEERLKGIDEAFKVLTEEPEVYEQAAYLYFLKANIYLEADDLENAYACIKTAYGCKNGNKNGMVLLTHAIILSRMGRSSEATVYIFRTYILFGEEFVTEKLGESAMEALEDYL